MTGNQLDLNHLWAQVQELSAILQANRDSAQGLVKRADEIRGRVANGEGVFLRDVNGELSGTREVELERELGALREENNSLRAETEDLSSLVSSYVTVLEKVMEGLRIYSNEHTMSTINIHHSYTIQLAHERQANAILRQNEAEAQGRLAAMAALLRQAYEAQTGNVEAEMVIAGLKYENAVLREALGLPKAEELLADEGSGGGTGGGGLIVIPSNGAGNTGDI
ncbi:hypothetical protein BDZ91DRAFT_690952 [Kalaharituber pfeilii]|nr:hypothetical protein BDZ91DRAFT_690952 [Kalaharituber pfeilii]